MADYWKSQPKKFCDFCKCWTADNKVSVEFHEKGKRHQENVKKKIDDLRKKSAQDAMKKQEDECDMKRMEKAALEAFKKDLIENPDLAAQYKVRVTPRTEVKPDTRSYGPEPCPEGSEPCLEGPKQCPEGQEPFPEGAADSEVDTETKAENEEKPLCSSSWWETLSPEGYSYYWNTDTNKVTWEKPSSYVSLADQKGERKDRETTSNKNATKGNKLKEKDRPGIGVTEKQVESTAKIKMETSKSESSPKLDAAESEDLPEQTAAIRPIEHPVYGTWEQIKTEQEEAAHVLDLQLPQPAHEEITLPTFTQEDRPKIKFREKKLTSLTDNATAEYVAFKKRKLGSGSRNMRQRDSE